MINVSVGIPAHNEEKNIRSLITSIIDQQSHVFKLKEIIVALDGCTDRTEDEVRSIKDKRLIIISDNYRHGKAKRLNQIYSSVKGDYLIQLDGDVKILDRFLFHKLVKCVQGDMKVDVIFGMQRPLPPKTFIGKLALFGFESWEVTKRYHKKDISRYNCFANLTAYSKKFLELYRLPEDQYVTDDTYSFYFAKSHHFKTSFLPKAEVHFTLPQTITDYTYQMSRYLSTTDEMRNLFSDELINKYETITNEDKLNGLVRNTRLTNIGISFSYVLLQLIPKIQNAISSQKKEWVMIKSSK